MSELRLDALTSDTMVLAPGRGSRPHSGESRRSDCPFCPGNESETPASILELRLPGSTDRWSVRVFPNLFPIVTSEPAKAEGRTPARGTHEVVVETPVHHQDLWERTPEHLLLTLRAYRARLQALSDTPGVRHVSVFRNQGAAAGASLEHPHSQIVAVQYLPSGVMQTVRRWRRYHRRTQHCLLCDEVREERRTGIRVIDEQAGFLLYAPQASARPAEMRLAPVRHMTTYASCSDDGLAGLSPLLLAAVRRLQRSFDGAAYNLVLQTWPASVREDPALHWYLRIIPRTSVIGGFELSTGDYVVTTEPEEAARRYRSKADLTARTP